MDIGPPGAFLGRTDQRYDGVRGGSSAGADGGMQRSTVERWQASLCARSGMGMRVGAIGAAYGLHVPCVGTNTSVCISCPLASMLNLSVSTRAVLHGLFLI